MRSTSRNLGLAVLLVASGWMIWPSAAQAQEAQQQPNVKQEAPATGLVDQWVSKRWAQSLTGLMSVNHPAHAKVAPQCSSCHTPQNLWLDLGFSKGSSHSIGVSVVPADATLRAQLALPAEKGLVVTNVDLNSSAWEAGIAQHDLLLSLDDKPLGSPDDLNNQVDAVGDKSGAVVVIRNGKQMKLAVTPKRVNLVGLVDVESVFSKPESRFRIGVELAAAEETLRAQLKLPEGQGVVVTNVLDDLPAAKAGIRKHDILLMLGDQPVGSHEEFREKLQKVGEKPVAIKLIREGKTISIEVTPQKHQEPAAAEDFHTLGLSSDGFVYALDVVRPIAVAGTFKGHDYKFWTLKDAAVAVTPADPQTRLQELIAQVKDLQNALEALREDLKKQQPTANLGEKK